MDRKFSGSGVLKFKSKTVADEFQHPILFHESGKCNDLSRGYAIFGK